MRFLGVSLLKSYLDQKKGLIKDPPEGGPKRTARKLAGPPINRGALPHAPLLAAEGLGCLTSRPVGALVQALRPEAFCTPVPVKSSLRSRPRPVSALLGPNCGLWAVS